MPYKIALLVSIMIFAFYALCMLGFLIVNQPTPCASQTPCPEGEPCPASCCDPATSPSRDPDETIKEYGYPWYAQWPVLFLLGTLGGILFCCIWCLLYKRSGQVFMCSFACCVRRPASERDSAGSVYPPPRYSRCGSFHQAPPPYSEVTSKPDLYPLVITYGDNDAKSGGNYLMVHYFRNYVIRAPGSLSATSTAESLNSSFICNAANEANSIIPPPYSCASNYEECGAVGCGRSLLRSLSSLTEPRETREPREPRDSRAIALRRAPDNAPIRHREAPTTFRENLITSPVQPLDPSYDLELELIDCEMYCDGGCKPRLGSSPPVHRSPSNAEEILLEHEPYGLRHLFACPSPEVPGTCESPPQPTSPTQTSRDSTLRRPSDDRRHRRIECAKKTPKARKSSLYMPLSVAYPVRTSRISPGARASSRSAPATPCSSLVPNILTFTQRVSASRHSSRSSRLEEEKDPLLTETEIHTDHKF
ncbi:uncharacterized protein LOC115454246 [Manduca sexta]|uniref:uncharacterized protein LOC115454246 n=1 Tax=Manduca sexta TaxID=7130 RepID=UPI0011826BC4|nr:uncharacterized protein LOC115454246 [Manduca sexta]